MKEKIDSIYDRPVKELLNALCYAIARNKLPPNQTREFMAKLQDMIFEVAIMEFNQVIEVNFEDKSDNQ